jgi:acyl dehydratase
MDVVIPKAQHAKPGDTFRTETKVITREDQEKFCEITGNIHPIFLDDKIAAARGWGKRLVPGVLTLSYSIGLLEQSGFLDDVVAFMMADKLRYLAPVHIGDALCVEVEFIENKHVKSNTRTLSTYKFTTYNQDGKPVLEAVNT